MRSGAGKAGVGNLSEGSKGQGIRATLAVRT